jgi:UDP-N-acetyl-D-glucosamine dehydrogenase
MAMSPAATEMWTELAARIDAVAATVAVIGLGYVGLPLAMAFARRGFGVIGYDVSDDRVATLNDGTSYILDVSSATVTAMREAGRFRATAHTAALREADAIIICVPTPCQRNRQPDLSYIESASRTIASVLRPGQLIILESTTYPGTTEELMVPILEAGGLQVGYDVQVAFSPERIDPGNPQFGVENTPKVVGGLGETAGALAAALYGAVIARVVRVDSPREAEMAKLIENTFRHVNIALANELALIAKKMGINIWQAIEAASSKPFGFMPFYPGPGVGGHCIPIDPHYLSWKAREMGSDASFIELAERINHGMPEHVVRMVVDAVNETGKSIRGAQVLLLGLAYKKDIDDLRESPALPIYDELARHGAVVSFHDPYVQGYRGRTSVPLTAETLDAADCVVLVTDHTDYDRALILAHARRIVDTRNVFKVSDPKVVRL